MLPRIVPSRLTARVLAVALVAAILALGAGVPVEPVGWLTALLIGALAVALVWDARASYAAWQTATPMLTRQLPAAFAIGVKRVVSLGVDVPGSQVWQCDIYDHADATLVTEGLPLQLTLTGGTHVEASYNVTPTQRGNVTFAPADAHVRSLWGLCSMRLTLGRTETRRVYPDFAQVSRLGWLAGRRRLQEIGIKTFQQRGRGTDFKQLSEYRVGDAVRHLDWRASLRLNKPIVREFQDDRDQAVLLMIDCGRRMRADEAQVGTRGSHFDHVLNAVMLLTYVALQHGDAVGASTFGTPPNEARSFRPRKGGRVLHSLMSGLYDVQPSLTHADYLAAAQRVFKQQPTRGLIVIITNFRDEDSAELQLALRLLRSRHLVLVASMRERVIGDLIQQPLTDADAAIRVASAHLYEQSRRDAFRRLAARDKLMLDVEPERLGVELVNRYMAAKASGLI